MDVGHHPTQTHQPLQRKPSSIFSALASIPSISSARFLPGPKESPTTLQLDYSISDYSRLTKLNATQSFHLSDRPTAPFTVVAHPIQFIDPQIVHQSPSPTGAKLAIFRTINDHSLASSASAKTQPQVRIDIWDHSINAIHASYDLTSTHQAFILNSTFGYPAWNPSETCLAYVAESILPESSSWLERNLYRPDLGEQLTEIRSPAVFVLSVDHHAASIDNPDASRPVRIIQLTPDPSDPNHLSTVLFAQPVFALQSGQQASEHHKIFCTGLDSLPDGRRLGLIYCQNRPSAIYQVDFKFPLTKDNPHEEKPIKASQPLQLSFTRISSLDRSARSPYVINDDTHTIVYLSNLVGGPHASCVSLHSYNYASRTHTVLVGPVDEPPALSAADLNPFPGLYVDQIPSQAQLSDPSDFQKKVIVMTSIRRSNKRPVTVELSSGIATLHYPPDEASVTLLGTDGHLNALFILSKTNLPPQLRVATLFRSKGLHFSWKWTTGPKPSTELQTQLSMVESRVIKLPSNDMGPTEIVLTTPTRKILDQLGVKKSSLIIIPHGGPHSTSVNEFSPSTASMALLGYSTAYINYPGSLGFGQKWVTELPKNLGVTDVESCRLALQYIKSLDFIKKLKVDKHVFIHGGSHGGFITAHLTSRYPDLFRAACLRNPVVDLVGTACGGSDIPDWSYAEANLDFPSLDPMLTRPRNERDAKVTINPMDFKTLRDRSPIQFVNNVKSPTLILLGCQDRRVSNQQGLAWYHGIKNLNNVRTELVLFDKDSHPLTSPFAQLHSFIAWLEFLAPYSHLSFSNSSLT